MALTADDATRSLWHPTWGNWWPDGGGDGNGSVSLARANQYDGQTPAYGMSGPASLGSRSG